MDHFMDDWDEIPGISALVRELSQPPPRHWTDEPVVPFNCNQEKPLDQGQPGECQPGRSQPDRVRQKHWADEPFMPFYWNQEKPLDLDQPGEWQPTASESQPGVSQPGEGQPTVSQATASGIQPGEIQPTASGSQPRGRQPTVSQPTASERQPVVSQPGESQLTVSQPAESEQQSKMHQQPLAIERENIPTNFVKEHNVILQFLATHRDFEAISCRPPEDLFTPTISPIPKGVTKSSAAVGAIPKSASLPKCIPKSVSVLKTAPKLSPVLEAESMSPSQYDSFLKQPPTHPVPSTSSAGSGSAQLAVGGVSGVGPAQLPAEGVSGVAFMFTAPLPPNKRPTRRSKRKPKTPPLLQPAPPSSTNVVFVKSSGGFYQLVVDPQTQTLSALNSQLVMEPQTQTPRSPNSMLVMNPQTQTAHAPNSLLIIDPQTQTLRTPNSQLVVQPRNQPASLPISHNLGPNVTLKITQQRSLLPPGSEIIPGTSTVMSRGDSSPRPPGPMHPLYQGPRLKIVGTPINPSLVPKVGPGLQAMCLSVNDLTSNMVPGQQTDSPIDMSPSSKLTADSDSDGGVNVSGSAGKSASIKQEDSCGHKAA